MPGTTVEELLSHGAWARRLAAALISDRHEADDLVQDTWVAAMKHPPAASGSPKAWIGRVMRNLASNRRRESARRIDREASVARTELQPSSDDVAQELEMHRALVDALASIDADQARTIVRRYFHGLSSAEIAREERVPESTVRNRLMRGLEALRAKLDSKYGNRNAWMAMFLPFANAKPALAAVSPVAAVTAGTVSKILLASVLVTFGAVELSRMRDSSRENSSATDPSLAGREVRGEPASRTDAREIPARERAPALEVAESTARAAEAIQETPARAPGPAASEVRRDPDPRSLPEDSLAEMREKVARLKSELDRRSMPLLMQRVADNLGVKLSADPEYSYSGLPGDSVDVYAVVTIPGQGTFRPVLPPGDYPELYELKNLCRGLYTRIRAAEFEEVRRQSESSKQR